MITPVDWSPPPRSVRDPADRPWVSAPPTTACGRALERMSAQYGFTARRSTPAASSPQPPALVRAAPGGAVVPTLALADAPAETVALPTVPVAGHRRIAAFWRPTRSGPEPLTSALVNALQEAAVSLGLTPVSAG